MEGPGGYQFVGRTLPVWNRFRTTPYFPAGRPWLLHFFDQIRWYPVGAEELLDMRAAMIDGQLDVQIEDTTLRLADYHRFLDDNAVSIAAFRDVQQQAFADERRAWAASGELARADELTELVLPPSPPDLPSLPDDAFIVEAQMAAAVWRVEVAEGDTVAEGTSLVLLEAMKMETRVDAPKAGRIIKVLVSPGQEVQAGTPLVALLPL
jgi:urea carboxylase